MSRSLMRAAEEDVRAAGGCQSEVSRVTGECQQQIAHAVQARRNEALLGAAFCVLSLSLIVFLLVAKAVAAQIW